jgi:S1-C subfamily serine protease
VKPHITSTTALVLALTFMGSVSANQVAPGRREGAPLITQGPGSDIRATVRELRDSDTRPTDTRGVVVMEVVRDGPAQRAGLIPGDIITQFDRQNVTGPTQFGRLVRDTPPRRAVLVVFLRMGISRETKVTAVPARAQ